MNYDLMVRKIRFTHLDKVSEPKFILVSISFYFILSLVKMRAYLFSGRFWAEEGTFFYYSINQDGFLKGLFYIFHGHMEFPTNLVVASSTIFPLQLAPLVTTYLSYFFQIIPIMLVVICRAELGLSRKMIFVVLLVAVGLPQSGEVWANSINLHFHFALLVVIIAALSPPSNGLRRYFFRFLIMLSGLSGIPANFLTPLFLLLAFFSGSKERWIQSAILIFTSVFQLSILLYTSFDSNSRDLGGPLLLYLFSFVSQSFTSPIFPFAAKGITLFLRNVLLDGKGVVIFAALAISAIFLMPFLIRLFRSAIDRDVQRITLAFGAIILVIMSITAALGDKNYLISFSGGGRYFYAPNVIFVIFFLSSGYRFNIVGKLLVVFLAISSAAMVPMYNKGPDWNDAYKKAIESNSSTVEIWPLGWELKFR